MQLIVKSSKVTTLAMQSVKSALAGDISSARGLLDEARVKGVEAHNVQTEMIQQEIEERALVQHFFPFMRKIIL